MCVCLMGERGQRHRQVTPHCALFVLCAAPERLAGVGLCPPDEPTCTNKVPQKGARVGDLCTAPCEAFGAGRWCPTTADHSGSKDTPWGWCGCKGMADSLRSARSPPLGAHDASPVIFRAATVVDDARPCPRR